LVVLRSQTPPDVWPVIVGAKVTATEHAAPGDRVRPVEQLVFMWYAAPVAGSMETSVHDHGWLPQLLTVTAAAVALPTGRSEEQRVVGQAEAALRARTRHDGKARQGE
jgi:hypothetical protein